MLSQNWVPANILMLYIPQSWAEETNHTNNKGDNNMLHNELQIYVK